jgi:hypothetical protein
VISLSLSLSLSFNTKKNKKNKKNNTLTLAEVTLSRADARTTRVIPLLLLKRGSILTNARKKRKGERKKKSLGYVGFRERPSLEREKSSTEKSDQTHHGDEFYLYERCERRLLLRLVVLARRREKRQWGFHWDGCKKREVVVCERFWSRKRERKSSREKNER